MLLQNSPSTGGHSIPQLKLCNIALLHRQGEKSNTPYPAATVSGAKRTPVKVLMARQIWDVSNALLRPTVLGEKTNRSNSKGGKACKLLSLQSLLWLILQQIHHNAWQTFEASESLTKSCVGGGQRRHGGTALSGPTWRHGWHGPNSGKERAELVVQMNAEAVQRIFGREMDAEAVWDVWSCLIVFCMADFAICARSFKSCWKLLSRWRFEHFLSLFHSPQKSHNERSRSLGDLKAVALEQASKATVPEGTAKEFLTNMATFLPQRHCFVFCVASWFSVWGCAPLQLLKLQLSILRRLSYFTRTPPCFQHFTIFHLFQERKLLTRLLARDKVGWEKWCKRSEKMMQKPIASFWWSLLPSDASTHYYCLLTIILGHTHIIGVKYQRRRKSYCQSISTSNFSFGARLKSRTLR